MFNFKTRLEARGYPKSLIERKISEASFAGRQSALKKQTQQTKGKIMPFVTTWGGGWGRVHSYTWLCRYVRGIGHGFEVFV